MNSLTRTLILALLAAAMPISGCATDVAAVAEHYRTHHDYASMAKLVAELKMGMTKGAVEGLLGPPTYSPGEGQYYYETDKTVSTGDVEMTMVLVVDYESAASSGGGAGPVVNSTSKLESFFFGPVGE